VWQTLCQEARGDANSEPALASYLFSTILAHRSLEDALAFVLANKLRSNVLLDSQLLELFSVQYRRDHSLVKMAQADMQAVMDRDPACDKYLQILLFFKGFQAIQAHRVAAALWRQDRKPLAMLLQSRISEIFHVDIHPGATIGEGVMLDHATGVVIGETAVVENNVSILHGVTLGGTGTFDGDRHPKIGSGVVIGAGVTILGNIKVGANSKIGAGSVVLQEIPENSTAVGIPARLVKIGTKAEPSLSMDQVSGLDSLNYNI
jgi:serine O-acetyltransferase